MCATLQQRAEDAESSNGKAAARDARNRALQLQLAAAVNQQRAAEKKLQWALTQHDLTLHMHSKHHLDANISPCPHALRASRLLDARCQEQLCGLTESQSYCRERATPTHTEKHGTDGAGRRR